MKTATIAAWVLGVMLTASGRLAPAAEPVTPENFKPPGENKPDEPLAKNFSADAAARFLDSAALDWNQRKNCFTCHTNYAYLYSRPALSSKSPTHDAVRKFAEQVVGERWKKTGPRWDTEVVAMAAALAYNDRATTGKLHDLTRAALDRMWTVQRDDGGWDWLKCDWPPLESDDHYGVTLAALAVGVAPGDYAKTEKAQEGIKRILGYLKNNPPSHLHHRAMLLWVSTLLEGFMTEEERKACVKALLALQRPDGGWAVAGLGDWKRADKTGQDLKTSDGYGTGFVVFILRKAGMPANDPVIAKGVAWLKANQRESGRWFTRSLHSDNKHYLTHAGTAFAVMALAECGEIKAEK